MRAARVLCVIAVCLGVPRYADAAAFEINDTSWEGASELLALARDELGTTRVIVLSQLDWSALEPTDALLLLHPEHVLTSENLAAFLDRGGRAAILDDYGVGDKILERFQIERVPAPGRPRLTLRQKPELAIAEPVRETGAAHVQAQHVTVQDVERLVTNHPTGLRNAKMTPVLRIRSVDGPDVLLALAGNFGSPPHGKLFAMGDPSALTNQMLRYPGNRSFAAGLLRYLVQDPGASGRGGRLLIFANRFSETGSFAGAGGLASEAAARAETIAEDLQRFGRDGLAGRIGIVLAGLVSLGVAVWTTTVSSRTYRPRPPWFARPTPLVAQGGLAGRAALLASESTPLALAALEVKSAFEEELATELGFRDHVSQAILLDEARTQRALDPAQLKSLQAVLLQLSKIETLVTARQPVRVRRHELLRFARTAESVMDALRRSPRREAAA